MAKYRIGIIGYGKIAQDQHGPAIAGSDRFELAAVSNGVGAAPAGVPSFHDYPQMLKDVANLDAVAICTPPGPRRVIAAECLAAGKHILLEKPPAGTVAEVTDIADRARVAKKVAFATYHAQHNAAVKRARDALAGKEVRTLHITWKEDIRRWHPGQDWILEAGGFGIFDPGVNAMSILTEITPQAIFIDSAELYVPANRQAPIAADLRFSTGLVRDEALTGALDWRQTGAQTWEIDVQTADGLSLKLCDGGARLEIDGQPPFVGPPDEYPDIYREFADLLDAAQSRMEAAPFQLIADAFMLGRRTPVEPFDW